MRLWVQFWYKGEEKEGGGRGQGGWGRGRGGWGEGGSILLSDKLDFTRSEAA